MVVTVKFRRASDPSCFYFTVPNVHINNGCARRRSVCIALLLLVLDFCMNLGAVILTGDFHKGAERVLASSAPTAWRRISPLESAFNCVTTPWPTSGVTPLWGTGGEPHGNMWPECCGFVVLPESQNQWLIMRHESINAVPTTIGLKTTDRTWHHEQWLHLKFSSRKRRRNASPADSKSRQKCLLHANT